MSKVLLVALSDDLGAERLVGAFTRVGARCATLSPPGFLCAASCHLERRFALPRHRGVWLGLAAARPRLERAVAAWTPDLLVPLDDVAALFLRNLAAGARVSDALGRLLRRSLGARAQVLVPCSRNALMDVASRHGIRVPPFAAVEGRPACRRAAERIGFPVVLKAEQTCGGHGVIIAPDAASLRRGRDTLRPSIATGAGVRALVRRLFWRAAGLRVSLPSLQLQGVVEGTPAMQIVTCRDGAVCAEAGFVALRTHPGRTGASTQVRFVRDAAMASAARRLVGALGCSGIVSFDFILPDDGSGAVLIEMNARPIGTTHLGALFGHDLCAPLVARADATAPAGDPAGARNGALPADTVIALFPKDLLREPADLGRFRRPGILHDVPVDDPSLARALLAVVASAHPDAAPAIRRAVASSAPTAPSAARSDRATIAGYRVA